MMAYQIMIRKIFPTQNLSLPSIIDTKYLEEKTKQMFLQDNKKYRVALCLCGKAENRFWDIDNFVKFINETEQIKKEISFFIIGSGPKQYEKAEQLISKSKSKNITNATNKTSLLEIVEFLKNIDLLISVDTGIVHLASINNQNIICLYGQSLPERSGAVNPNAVSLCTYEKCSPCNDGKQSANKVCSYPKCMQNITVEMVVEKVKEILN